MAVGERRGDRGWKPPWETRTSPTAKKSASTRGLRRQGKGIATSEPIGPFIGGRLAFWSPTRPRPYLPTLGLPAQIPGTISVGLCHCLSQKKTWKNHPLGLALDLDLIAVVPELAADDHCLDQVKHRRQYLNLIANPQRPLPECAPDLGLVKRGQLLPRNAHFSDVHKEPFALMDCAPRRQVDCVVGMRLRDEYKRWQEGLGHELGLPLPGQPPLDPYDRNPGDEVLVSKLPGQFDRCITGATEDRPLFGNFMDRDRRPKAFVRQVPFTLQPKGALFSFLPTALGQPTPSVPFSSPKGERRKRNERVGGLTLSFRNRGEPRGTKGNERVYHYQFFLLQTVSRNASRSTSGGRNISGKRPAQTMPFWSSWPWVSP